MKVQKSFSLILTSLLLVSLMSCNSKKKSDAASVINPGTDTTDTGGASSGGTTGGSDGGSGDSGDSEGDGGGVEISTLPWMIHLGLTTKAIGGINTGKDFCLSSASDSEGNAYCAGYTTGSLGETNGGGNDAFIMKVDTNGGLVWLKHFGNFTKASGGSNTGSEQCNGVAVDSSGNVYCAGKTNGAMGEANGGGDDAFVMKLDKNGNLVWLKHFGLVTKAPGGSNAGADSCNGVAVDGVGNVYCSGSTNGAMGEANGSSPSSGHDAFVMKLDKDGNLLWLTHFGNVTKAPSGSNAGFYDYCNGVSVDLSGNVYCAGFTSSSMAETNGGNYDAFVMKLNSSGGLIWLKQLGQTTKLLGGDNSGYEYCNGVSVDPNGNVYCAGETSGPMMEQHGGGVSDPFVLKFDSSGNLLWVKHFGDSTTTGTGNNSSNEVCHGVTSDSNGNVYCAGRTFGAMSETNGGSDDVFVMKLDTNGSLVWHTQLGFQTKASGGSNTGSERCHGVSVDPIGNVFCAGRTNGAIGEANGSGPEDAFILKLDTDGNII
jgi:hypothetical protein